MEIENLKNLEQKTIILSKDINGREIYYIYLQDIVLIGKNIYYPNVLLYNKHDKRLMNPYDECIMSLQKESFYEDNIYTNKINEKIESIEEFPIFFFIYHFDNYYHFLYDSLPYLLTFQYLKQKIPSLKLLIQFPLPHHNKLYSFNKELLQKIVNKDDIIYAKPFVNYKYIYISGSYTHGGLSNLPPRKEIYNIYYNMKTVVPKIVKNQPYIYISRRTWIHNDLSNIGTNYTTRRKMMNEDELVKELNMLGIEEIFTENLTMDEKIVLFKNAKLVIGAIGGGMANLLFSPSSTHSIVLNTPFFLDINNRFRYSFEHTKVKYFNEIETFKNKNTIPLYCRVRILESKRIGEIEDYEEHLNKYHIKCSNNDSANFHNDSEYEKRWYFPSEFQLIDKGLNSPYKVDIKKLIKLIKDELLDTKC